MTLAVPVAIGAGIFPSPGSTREDGALLGAWGTCHGHGLRRRVVSSSRSLCKVQRVPLPPLLPQQAGGWGQEEEDFVNHGLLGVKSARQTNPLTMLCRRQPSSSDEPAVLFSPRFACSSGDTASEDFSNCRTFATGCPVCCSRSGPCTVSPGQVLPNNNTFSPVTANLSTCKSGAGLDRAVWCVRTQHQSGNFAWDLDKMHRLRDVSFFFSFFFPTSGHGACCSQTVSEVSA